MTGRPKPGAPRARKAPAALQPPRAVPPRHRLRLYVAGMTPRSARAVANIKEICEEHLKGRYVLEVIDVYQQPVLAAGDQIIAVPTLVKQRPPPLRRFIGDLSDRARVLAGLDLVPTR